MTKNLLATAVLATGLLISFGANASTLVKNDLTASAKIVKKLVITEVEQMHFGTWMSDTSAYTVTLDTADATTESGSNHYVDANPHPNSAIIKVQGSEGLQFAVSFSDATLNGPSSATMGVTSITATAASYTIPAAGEVQFGVGGQLAVGANQADGDYSGNYSITLTY